MPWDCAACGMTVEVDRAECPSCQAEKQAWTLHGDRTRVLVVPPRALECLVGESTTAAAAEAPQPAPETLRPAEDAPVLSLSAARRLAAEGQAPAPAHVLVVRVAAPALPPPTITVGVDYARRELTSHELPTAPGPAGRHHTRLLLVAGPDPEAGLPAFAGIEVLDVSEDPAEEEGSAGDFAPSIEVSSGRRGPIELPTRRADERGRLLHIELEDACFETGRAVLLPDLAEAALPEGEPGEHDLVGGLDVIRAALELLERVPHKQVLIAGHTDTVGQDADNFTLSRARAQNVLLYLTGQREAWAAHAQEHFAMADVQRVLRWTADTLGWDTDPGPIDGDFGPATRGARDRWRERLAAERGLELPRHVAQSAADWAAVYDLYDEALAERLGVAPEALGELRARVRPVGPGAVGCGERWPREAIGTDGFESRANRRVDLLFFDAHDLPDLACHAGGGCAPERCPLYSGERYHAERLPVDLDDFVDPDAPFELWARLFDQEGAAPLADTPWRVELGDGRVAAGVTDERGELRAADVPIGHFFLEVEREGARRVTISSLRTPRAPAHLRVRGVPSPATLPTSDDLPSLPDDYDVGGEDAP